jgi:CheY-like chemotaxis protein
MSTWMVVEDEPDLYDTLLALFEIWSIDGVAFTNGTDAIKWIDDVDKGDTDTNIPELAILDIRLPGATGPEIGARLRKSPVLKDIAIVLMTAYHLAPTGEKEVIAQAQADSLLYKPLPAPPEFQTLLKKAIDRRRVDSQPDATPKSPPPDGDNSTGTGAVQ